MRLSFSLGRRLRRNDEGVATIEFALVIPGLVLFVVGIAQLGILFMANAGLRNAVAEGARFATIHPRPTDTQIRTRIIDSDFGLEAANLTTPAITHGTSDGAEYIDISVTYSVPLDFIFFSLPPVSLTESRRAFVYPLVT
jgi:Flp pilus assembly protein TadG